MIQEKQGRNIRNILDKLQTNGEQSFETSIYSEIGQEQCDFQKCIKEKQGKLFTDEPDYLKGSGFSGDGDDINNDNKTVDISNIQINFQNKSHIGHRNSQSSLISERLNTPTKDFDINSKFKDYRNDHEQESRQSYSRNNGSTNSKQNDNQNNNRRFNFQTTISKNLSQNLLKKQEIPIQIEIFDGTVNKVQTNNGSQNEEYKCQSNHKNQQQGINQMECYLNQTNTNTIQQITAKTNKSQKVFNSYQNVYLAKNIIKSAINKSECRKSRLNQHILDFINKLRDLSFSRSHKHLSEQEHILINDLCAFNYKHQKQQAQPFSFIKTCQRITQNIPSIQTFMPSCLYLMIWNIFIIAFTFCFIYTYSIFIFFDNNQLEEGYLTNLFLKIACSIFIFDILVNLNIEYYDEDNVIKDRSLIFKRYLSSYLILDFASLIVLIYQLSLTNHSLQYNPNHSALLYFKNILLFAKIFCLQEKKERVLDVFMINQYYKPIYKLLSLAIFLIITTHSGNYILQYNNLNQNLLYINKVGILWHLFAVIENKHGIKNTWLFIQNIQDSPYYIRYIYSIYWSALTMFSIGYGDIIPANEYESLFCTICAIFLFCVFAYSFNQFGIILQESEQNSKNINEEINKIQRFLHHKKINTELQCRVRSYLQLIQKDEKNKYFVQDQTVFNKLSVKLRDEVTSSINKIVFSKYQLFFKQFSQQTINQMTFIMKEVLISPNEIIFNGDELDDQSIYFIEDGLIEIYHSATQQFKSHHQIKLLNKNDFFGEISFFSGGYRRASARSLNLSTLYKIKRNEFIEIIKKNQYDFEKFKMIQDQILNYNDLSSIQTKCFACQSLNHLALNCPKIHQKFDSQCICLKSAFSQDQKRCKKDRKPRKNNKSWNFINSHHEYIQMIQENHMTESSQKQINYDNCFYKNNQNINTSQGSSVKMNKNDQFVFNMIYSDHPQKSQQQQSSNRNVNIDIANKSYKDDGTSYTVLNDLLPNQDISQSELSLSEYFESPKVQKNNMSKKRLTNKNQMHLDERQYSIEIVEMWKYFMKNLGQVRSNINKKKFEKQQYNNNNNNNNNIQKFLKYQDTSEQFQSFQSLNTVNKFQQPNFNKKVTFDQNNINNEEQYNVDSPENSYIHKDPMQFVKQVKTINCNDILDQGTFSVFLETQNYLLESLKQINVNNSQQLSSNQLSQSPQSKKPKQKNINYLIPSYNNNSSIKSQQSFNIFKQQLSPFHSKEMSTMKPDILESQSQLPLKQEQRLKFINDDQQTLLNLINDTQLFEKKEQEFGKKQSLRDTNPYYIFDQIKSYKYYFPHNNFEKIIKQLQLKRQERHYLQYTLKNKKESQAKKYRKESLSANNLLLKQQIKSNLDNSNQSNYKIQI